ncbi:serine-threonine protein kinase [Streptomyces sp. N35]|uniref:serine-threonine protein kinase n=1 Tax=Streptomyces sp. N35 TaxID=2795730 RepID=UPI0018F429CB|nr:serine-threonine protein kinase [Streptomyces sp. N35]
MPEFSVAPYRELTFDADGDVQAGQLAAVRALRVRDLVVFAHGWNNDRSMATTFYDRFFAPFAALDPPGTTGYVGVLWPAMGSPHDPLPDSAPRGAAGPVDAVGPALRPELDEATRQALRTAFPDRADVVDRLARMLAEQPTNHAAFDEFGLFVRKLAEVPPRGAPASFAQDIEAEDAAPGSTDPAMLFDDPATVCRAFTDALEELGAVPSRAREGAFGIGLDRLWDGGKELLRQGTYYAMKRRAGTVGQLGLGPALGELAERNPDLRIHLVGHSFGARLVSFALRGLPKSVTNVKSVTLLQGAFSHHAFAPRLPHQAGGGVLRGQERRIDGPLVCCHSEHDAALKVFYPLASRLAGDSTGLLGDDPKWGALGYGGIKGVDGTKRLTLAQALAGGLPKDGCVNVDAAAKVRRGGPPSGAHSDILHKELAQVVLAAGRIRA